MMDGAKRDGSLSSTPAIISFIILAMYAVSLIAAFVMAILSIEMKPLIQNTLSGMIGALTVAFAGVVAYWTGSSVGSKTANAALAQLAGAGPPPPADPATGQTLPPQKDPIK